MEKRQKKVMSDMVAKPRVTTPPARRASPPPRSSGRISDELEDEAFQEDIYDEKSIDELIHRYGDKPKTRIGCVLWVVALLGIIALVFVIGGQFTHASVTVVPKTFSGTVDISLALTQERTAASIQVGIATKDFQSQQIIPATGRSQSDAKASGTIRIYNATTSAKLIPAGTIIDSSTQVQYATAKSVTVPKEKSASVPGQADVGITAVLAGDAGNGSLDDFTFAKASSSTKGLTIHSTIAATGGASGNEAVADPAALAAAEGAVKSNLSDQSALVARLSQELPDDAIALPLVIPLADSTISIDGTKSDGVHVIADRTVSTLIVNRSAIADVMGAALSVPAGMSLTLSSFDGLTITSSDVAQGQTVPSIIHIRITGPASVTGNVKPSDIAAHLAGVSRSQARTILGSISELKSFSFRIIPPWRRLLPDASQITVLIKPS